MTSESAASGQNVAHESVVARPRPAVQASVSTYSSPAEGARAGGDWCEVVTLSESLVVLTVGDVSGHGMSVAPTMTVMRRSVLRACQEGQTPSDVLAIANAVAGNIGDGVLVTAIVALVDQRRRTLTFSNAGHPPPLLLTSNEHAFLAHPPADLPLGIFSHLSAATYVVAFPADALLVLYTDGITEHEADPIAGEVDLVEAARAAYGVPGRNLARTIAERVFATRRGNDDAVTLALRAEARSPTG
ncbi:MAG: PP2C family protein-serine/threonine phosphatase [Vulcanimicrobiaceae bacterium]|jgi:serine phosphatase RsbU (regulator of sigma subunit)